MVEKQRDCRELKVRAQTPWDTSAGPLEEFQDAKGVELVVLRTKELKLCLLLAHCCEPYLRTKHK